jgi:hypothetical protein
MTIRFKLENNRTITILIENAVSEKLDIFSVLRNVGYKKLCIYLIILSQPSSRVVYKLKASYKVPL